MDKINLIKSNKTQFKGFEKMDKNKSLDENLDESLKRLQTRAEREVCEYGDFAPVYEQFKNTDKSLCATDFVLKISKPPKNIEGHEKIRNLEACVYKLPHPYKAERIISTGTKEDILKVLASEDLPAKIKSALITLSENLEDI